MMAIYYALVGGSILGLAATGLLYFNGRVCGISGIASQILQLRAGGLLWRVAFILGLVCSGVLMSIILPDRFAVPVELGVKRFILFAISGVLVGLGSTLGSGCTSGHGICGISRFSVRSIVATLTFMGAGILTVLVLKLLGAIE